jgi:hypothetical protein
VLLVLQVPQVLWEPQVPQDQPLFKDLQVPQAQKAHQDRLPHKEPQDLLVFKA